APERTAGPADDLDALDVLEHHVLGVPEHAGIQRRIDGSPIDQYQQLVRTGAGAVKSTRADGVPARIDLCDLQIRSKSQGVRESPRARSSYIVGRDDEHGGRSVGEPLGPL